MKNTIGNVADFDKNLALGDKRGLLAENTLKERVQDQILKQQERMKVL